MTKLSDSQLVILGAACERPDGAVYPLTSKLKGGALAKVLNSLVGKGLIKEVRAKRDETVWRRDDDERPLTLTTTPAAFEALGIGQGEAPTEADAAPSQAKSKRTRGQVTIGFCPDGRPGEVFTHGARSGSGLDALLADACVVVSCLIQHGAEPRDLAASMGRLGTRNPPRRGHRSRRCCER